jgi:hypothetical protein
MLNNFSLIEQSLLKINLILLNSCIAEKNDSSLQAELYALNETAAKLRDQCMALSIQMSNGPASVNQLGFREFAESMAQFAESCVKVMNGKEPLDIYQTNTKAAALTVENVGRPPRQRLHAALMKLNAICEKKRLAS